MKRILLPTLAISALACMAATPARAWMSSKVQYDSNNRLTYPVDANGDRIPDFSHAGYKGGGVPLPTIPVVKTISPVSGDNTAAIQAAIDEVGAMPIQANGYRGTLLLSAGTYEVDGTLKINHSGVVLAGVGNDSDPASNTVLRRTGTTTAQVIIAGGGHDDQFKSEVPNTRSQITTPEVQVGSFSFDVDHPELYQVGDNIIIWQPSTQAWLDAVDRGGVTDSNYWKPGEIDIRYHRYITAISGNTITIDAPVFDHLKRSLSQSYVYKYDRTGVVTNVGIEKIFVDIVTNGPTSEDHCEDAIAFVQAEDCWIRNSTEQHFWHAGVQFGGSATRCTAENCRAIDPNSIITGGRRYNFSTYHAQLILFTGCYTSYARHAFVCNGTSLDSGIVFLNGTIDYPQTSSEGHRRWSQGILYDSIKAGPHPDTNDIIRLYNRNTYGTGHGWAVTDSVAWNCDANGGKIVVQKPPIGENYAIGCLGNITGVGPFEGPPGFIEGANQSGLEPQSLYTAQLDERLADVKPVLTQQPLSQTVAPGGSVTFTVASSGTGTLTYQWYKDGTAIAGATSASLTLNNLSTDDDADYTVKVTTDAGGSSTSRMARLIVATPSPGRIVNMSVRGTVGIGGQPLIVGFAVSGGSKSVLIRAVGPSLAPNVLPEEVPSLLADPSLEMHETVSGHDQLDASNDDWGSGDITALQNAFAVTGAYPFSDTSSKDAALLVSATATRTVHAKAPAGKSGIALVEVYDAGTGNSVRLVNVSARNQVGTGANVLIAGFAISGNVPEKLLIRGLGPGLAPNVLPDEVAGLLADPQLKIYTVINDQQTLVAENDNWGDEPGAGDVFSQVGAYPLTQGSKDAAVLVTLPAGLYTAVLSGANDTTGDGLVEVYEVP